jgi:hypothetical protein
VLVVEVVLAPLVVVPDPQHPEQVVPEHIQQFLVQTQHMLVVVLVMV